MKPFKELLRWCVMIPAVLIFAAGMFLAIGGAVLTGISRYALALVDD